MDEAYYGILLYNSNRVFFFILYRRLRIDADITLTVRLILQLIGITFLK